MLPDSSAAAAKGNTIHIRTGTKGTTNLKAKKLIRVFLYRSRRRESGDGRAR
jgi:hypothetical protein